MSGRLKRALVDLDEKHHLIADSLMDAIWIVDAETLKFEYITDSIEKISGYRADEYLKLSLGDRIAPESFRKVISILAEEKIRFDQNPNLKDYRSLELELIHKNGSTYWVEVRVKFHKENRNGLKIIGATKGISKRKRIEQKQKETIKKLAQAIAEKERLLREVKILQGLLPICSGCRRIRDEHDKWWPLDVYIEKHTEAEVTHTICPDCEQIAYI
jgi:PAS domain S-box-containing protein